MRCDRRRREDRQPGLTYNLRARYEAGISCSRGDAARTLVRPRGTLQRVASRLWRDLSVGGREIHLTLPRWTVTPRPSWPKLMLPLESATPTPFQNGVRLMFERIGTSHPTPKTSPRPYAVSL